MRFHLGDLPYNDMEKCNICPRGCGIDRNINKGFCGEKIPFVLHARRFTSGKSRAYQEIKVPARYSFRVVICGACTVRITESHAASLEKK